MNSKSVAVGLALFVLTSYSISTSAFAQRRPDGASGRPALGGGERVRQRRSDDELKVGQLAPLFALASVDGEDIFELGQFRGQKPVVLFFGSYS